MACSTGAIVTTVTYCDDMAISASSDIQRIAAAAASPGWDLTVVDGAIVAIRDSGVEGMPFTVIARKGGRGFKVAKYQPGDDTSVEGEDIGEISGNPRDMGRALRSLLEDA